MTSVVLVYFAIVLLPLCAILAALERYERGEHRREQRRRDREHRRNLDAMEERDYRRVIRRTIDQPLGRNERS